MVSHIATFTHTLTSRGNLESPIKCLAPVFFTFEWMWLMALSVQHVGEGVAAGVIPIKPHRVRVLLNPTVATVVVFMQSSTKPEGSILPSGNCKHWPSACHHWCAVRHLLQPQLWAHRQYHVTAACRDIRTPKYEMPPNTTFGSNSKECFAVLVVKDLSSLVVKKICKRLLPWGEACGTALQNRLGVCTEWYEDVSVAAAQFFNRKYRKWVSSNSFLSFHAMTGNGWRAAHRAPLDGSHHRTLNFQISHK